jgi:cobalt-zinc-cadmium efflux system outer membrane protein
VVETTQARVQTEVSLARRRYEEAAAAAKLYGGEVKSAVEQNLALGTEAYRAGKIDFLQLMLIRRSAIDAEVAAIESAEELAAAKAELDRATGRATP